MLGARTGGRRFEDAKRFPDITRTYAVAMTIIG